MVGVSLFGPTLVPHVFKFRAPSDSSSSHSYSFPIADSRKRQMRSSSKSRSATPSTSAGRKYKHSLAESAPQVLPDIGLAQSQKSFLEAARSKTPSDGASVQSVVPVHTYMNCPLTVLQGTVRRLVFQNWKETSEERRCLVLFCVGLQSCLLRQLSLTHLVLRLGAKSLAGISPTAKLSLSSYAHDRHITGLTNVQFTVNTKELEDSKTPASEIEEFETVASEINEMLRFYEEMTQYMKSPIAKVHVFSGHQQWSMSLSYLSMDCLSLTNVLKLCGSISAHKSTRCLLARTLGSFFKSSGR